MSDAKLAQNLERFRIGVASHDRENAGKCVAWGIGLAFFDLQRLGFEDGERLWEGITVNVDGGESGNFRVLCENLGAGEKAAASARELVEA